MRKFQALLILLFIFSEAVAQVNTWEFGIGPQVEAIYGLKAPVIPADQLFPVHPDAAHYEDTVNLNGGLPVFRLNLRKRFKSWLSAGLMVNFLNPGGSGSTQLYPEGFSAEAYRTRRTVTWQNSNRVGQYRQVDVYVDSENESLAEDESSWGISPYALFDLKMQDPNASFSILLGFDYHQFQLIDRIHLESSSLDAAGAPYVDRSYGISRRITSLALMAGLEWQDYFSKHWGYAVGLRLSPWMRANTTKVVRESLVIKGVPVAMEELRYRPSADNGFPQEEWKGVIGGLNLSVFYRFNL